MKVIDKLRCPPDYDCYFCKRFDKLTGKCQVYFKEEIRYNVNFRSVRTVRNNIKFSLQLVKFIDVYGVYLIHFFEYCNEYEAL